MKQIGRNILSLGLSRVVSGAVLFVVYIWLARYLGPDNFGRFSLVLAYYTIFLLLIDFGISKFFIKKVSEDQSVASVYLGNFFVAQIPLALLVVLAFAVIPNLAGYDQEIDMAMLVTGFGLLAISMSIPFAALAQAWQKIHWVAFVYFVNTLITAGWLAFTIATGRGIVFIFWMYLLIGIVDIFIIALLTRKIAVPEFTFDKKLISRMFLYGLPFAFLTGFEVLIQKIDVIIQKVFLPFFEVGLYSSAYRFIDILTFIPAIIAMSLFPYFASKTDLNEKEVIDTSNRFNKYAMMIALPLGVGGMLLADKIILTLFSEQYLGSVESLRILIWASVVSLIYAVPGIMMIVKRTRQSVYILGAATLVNVVLNWLLIPIYGIIASAWITTATYLLVAGLYIYYAYKMQRFSLFQFSLVPAIASLLMGILIWYLRDWNLFVLIILASAVYLLILVSLRFLRREDWEFLKQAVGLK